MLAIAMIETPGGLDELKAIAAVPGIDGLFAGPSDIASSLGRPPRMDTDDPEVMDALQRIAAHAIETNIIAGLACETSTYAIRGLVAAICRLAVRAARGRTAVTL